LAKRQTLEWRKRLYPEAKGMGTTVVMIAIETEDGGQRLPITGLFTAHIGDSRIYKISGKEIEQIGKDHSQVQKLIDEGALTPAEARKSRLKNIILQALGSDEQIETEIHGPIDLKPGDAFLLCSDGLNDMLEDEEIAKIVSKNPAEKAVKKLIDAANEAGGKDNITVCVIKFEKKKKSFWSFFRR